MQIISRATLDRNINVLHSAGADLVMSHASMAANTLLNILNPGRVLMLTEGLNIFRYKVHSSLAGSSLVESGIRENTGCSVIAIHRAGSMQINPDPSKALRNNDEIIMIGTAESEKKFVAMYPEEN
jgi:K+/H+ antiporter YhaU regulatory subunit KhtT